MTERGGSVRERSGASVQELIGCTAVVELHRCKGPHEEILGVVEDVLSISATGAAHPLLKVVKPATGGGEGAESAREEHLIPLVRSIVPRVDRQAARVYIDPPPGLLELGRRRLLLQRLR